MAKKSGFELNDRSYERVLTSNLYQPNSILILRLITQAQGTIWLRKKLKLFDFFIFFLVLKLFLS